MAILLQSVRSFKGGMSRANPAGSAQNRRREPANSHTYYHNLLAVYTKMQDLLQIFYHAVIHQLLEGFEDSQLGVVPGEASLEVDGVGRLDGAVG